MVQESVFGPVLSIAGELLPSMVMSFLPENSASHTQTVQRLYDRASEELKIAHYSLSPSTINVKFRLPRSW